jgi:hypothetical protein
VPEVWDDARGDQGRKEVKTAKWLSKLMMDQPPGSIDPKFFNQVAQFAHFGMMFTVTTIVTIIGGKLGHPYSSMLAGFAFCATYAWWHEFIWDPVHENPVTRGSDLEDFIFLVGGSATAVIVLFLGGL